MVASILNQFGDIAGGDLLSNIGIARQIGSAIYKDGYQLGDIQIDTVTEEAHESTVTATSQPVEFGVEPTDHVYANPHTVNIQGVVSDIAPGAFFDVGLIGLAAKFTKGLTGAEQSRSQLTWSKLVEMQQKGEPIDLVTTLRTYPNMIIVSLSTSQNKDTASEIRFSASLRERKIIKSELFSGSLIGNLSPKKPTSEIAKNIDPVKQKTAEMIKGGEVQGKVSSDSNPSFARILFNKASS